MSILKSLFYTFLLSLLSLKCFAGETIQCSFSELLVDSLYSESLQEQRKLFVYLPEEVDANKTYPVIFAADGQILYQDNYNIILDSLIRNHIIPPVILVGAYSNETLIIPQHIPFRYYEYTEQKTKDPQLAGRFNQHLNFFLKELREYISQEYRVRYNDQYLLYYGFSNGGDYGLSLFQKHPQEFSHLLCFSPVGTSAKDFTNFKKEYPNLYIAYGNKELEPPVGFNLSKLDKKLKKKSYPHIKVNVYDGGHQRELWKEEFVKSLVDIFSSYEP